ncbi:MAG: glycoside hydrolase family 5 protein [Oscillospiraceae bacterium]|nr:glycoside hydrolase family 5 protein [Oscillospiraceae bacterium]
MKKILSHILSVTACIFMFVSCSGPGISQSSSDSSSSLSSSAHDPDDIRDIPSSDLVKEMKIGWSLGNTLDSAIGSAGGSPEQYETGWGNPLVTKELITSVKDAGFNIIRIPVSWGEHVSQDEKYTIDPQWMSRVHEVVDYAIDQDMFVILNTHHEDWLFPSYDTLEANKTQLCAMWTQIGNCFEGYNEKLIFEGLNEPRKKGTAVEWNGGDSEGQECVNLLNEAFVKTIRSLSGNNPKRHLMIPTYAASSTDNAINSFTVPDDDKLIVSVHAYIPYSFALEDGGTDYWDRNDASCTNEIDHLIDLLSTRFTQGGIPVIIGEMGATGRSNEENRCSWAQYYISQASQAGIPCIWWDNGVYIGKDQAFGLISRKSCTWIYSDIVDSLMSGLK